MIVQNETYMGKPDLSGVTEFHNCRFIDCDLRGMDLNYRVFEHVQFDYCNMRGVKLIESKLKDCEFLTCDLRSASMGLARLDNLYLLNTVGNRLEIRDYALRYYDVYIYGDKMQIGCTVFTKDEWFSMNDHEIAELSLNAAPFWARYKDFLRGECYGD